MTDPRSTDDGLAAEWLLDVHVAMVTELRSIKEIRADLLTVQRGRPTLGELEAFGAAQMRLSCDVAPLLAELANTRDDLASTACSISNALDDPKPTMEPTPIWANRVLRELVEDRAQTRIELAAARTQLADAEAEIERLRGQVEDWVPMIETDKPLFTTGRDGTIGISMRGARKLIGVMAAAMAKMLADAPNYVEMEAKTVGGPRYIIRIQRAEKPTPHQLRQAADARAESAESSLAACRAREAAIRQLHKPYPMYDECEHNACDEAWEADNGVYVCGDVTRHICDSCRNEDGDGVDWPCPTAAVLGDETGTDKAEPSDDLRAVERRLRAILAAVPYFGDWDEWAAIAYDKIPVLPRAVMAHVYGRHDDTLLPYSPCPLCELFRTDGVGVLDQDGDTR